MLCSSASADVGEYTVKSGREKEGDYFETLYESKLIQCTRQVFFFFSYSRKYF